MTLIVAILSKTIKKQSKSIKMIREACPTLAPQRREHIRLLVRESGIARVEDLRRELKVSVATIRPRFRIIGGRRIASSSSRWCGEHGKPSGRSCF